MKTYYCKNGESVGVEFGNKNSNQIDVVYKGRRYPRQKSDIGKTLFKEDPTRVWIHSKITLVNVATEETSMVEIIENHTTVRYTGMGGSYYGAHTEVVSDSKAGEYDGNLILITENSPIGKAAIGKKQGDMIEIIVNANNIRYKIEKIDNSYMIL